jgi:hypothetical protein
MIKNTREKTKIAVEYQVSLSFFSEEKQKLIFGIQLIPDLKNLS